MHSNGKITFKLPFLFLLLTVTQQVYAKQILAVLEIIPTADASVSISETQYVTNELRRQATLTLPQDSYTVLTRDNLISLMPQDEKEADRLIESGVIGIGKAIGAGYVTQGYIKVFDKFLSLSVELYETEEGRLVSNMVLEAPSTVELLKLVRENSAALFAKIDKSISLQISDPAQGSVPTEISTPSSSGSFWTAKNTVRIISFALSAVSLGIGIWQDSEVGRNDKKAGSLGEDATQALKLHGDGKEYESAYSAYESKLNDAKGSEKLRNGFYIGAGVFSVAGVVTFFF
jgi:hypothetical protein